MQSKKTLKAIYIHQAVQLAGKLNNFMTIDEGFQLEINERGNVEARHKTKTPNRIVEISFTNLSCALWEETEKGEDCEEKKAEKKVISIRARE